MQSSEVRTMFRWLYALSILLTRTKGPESDLHTKGASDREKKGGEECMGKLMNSKRYIMVNYEIIAEYFF